MPNTFEPPHADPAPLRLLVVDDTPALRTQVAQLLRSRCPATVIEAENGVQALKRMQEHVFALMVTDVNMPLLDGLKLTSLVRQDPVHKGIPILVMTTEANQVDRSRALAMGASDYLKKPAADDDVVRRVQSLLARHRAAGAPPRGH
jgi:two-component system chemotaxis response regulator CheY